MKENFKKICKDSIPIAILLIIGIIIAGAATYLNKSAKPGGIMTINPTISPSPTASPSSEYKNLDDFAKCLTQKEVKFYGAWWCPHCRNQKAEFGDSMKYVDYIECEKTPGVSQGDIVQTCTDAKIEAFPTWIFPDGTKQLGELPLEKIKRIIRMPINQ